jgi:hypothetical protein
MPGRIAALILINPPTGIAHPVDLGTFLRPLLVPVRPATTRTVAIAAVCPNFAHVAAGLITLTPERTHQ